MNNQVFIQPDFTIEKAQEEDILHTLIQAQLSQSLADIETLVQASNNLTSDKTFTVSQTKKEHVTDGLLLKTGSWKSFFAPFFRLKVYFKRVWRMT